MQRIIGGILVIAATSGIGFLYSKELQIYLEKMLNSGALPVIIIIHL